MLFHWEPEGRYHCTKSMALASFWFLMEHNSNTLQGPTAWKVVMIAALPGWQLPYYSQSGSRIQAIAMEVAIQAELQLYYHTNFQWNGTLGGVSQRIMLITSHESCSYMCMWLTHEWIPCITLSSFVSIISEFSHMFGQALAQWRAFSLAVARSSRLHSFSRSGHLSRCCMVCSEVPHSQAASAVSA